MRSSTSSSSSSSPRSSSRARRSPAALWVGAAAFGLLAVLGPAVPPWGQLAFGAAGRVPGPLPAGDWYADYTPGRDAYSHRIFWHDIGKSVENARRADVVFFGDSRTLFALSPEVARPFFADRGLRWFQLSFAHGERLAFALNVMQRHAIEPRLAIVDAGRFFQPGVSSLGLSLVSEAGTWPGLRDGFETRAQYAFDANVRPIFPHLLPMLFDVGSSRGLLDVMRSPDDGAWLVRRYRDTTFPLEFHDVPLSQLPDAQYAKVFQQLIEQNGGRLVLTHVPADGSNRARAASLAAQLGVPFVAPQLDGLVTADGIHLAPESARRFATALLSELEESGAFAPPGEAGL